MTATEEKEKKWHILFININEIQERKDQVNTMIHKLKEKGVDSTVIDAFYWKSHDVPKLLADQQIQYCSNYDLNQPVFKAQVCCFLSHLKAWKYIASREKEDNNTNYIILEDDMELKPDFDIHVIDQRIKTLPPDYDFVNLWRHPIQIENQKKNIYNDYFSKYYFNYGACSYTVSQKFAKELIQINKYVTTIDDMLNHFVLPYRKTYISLIDYFENKGDLDRKNKGTLKSTIWVDCK